MSLQPFKAIRDFIQYQRDKRNVILTYEHHFGRKFHWNHPTRYTEKLNKFKISQEAESLWRYVDKYEVRKYYEKVIGPEYLIPMIGIYNSVDEIPFDTLPKKFVLKATHGSGWNIICRDKSKLDWEDAKKKLNLWLTQNYYKQFGWERQYKKITPRIICEEYLDLEQSDMIELKFFCFNGKPEYLQGIKDRLGDTRRQYYSLNWKKLPFRSQEHASPINGFPRPKNLELMVELVTKLAKPFRHVRVDFYYVGGKIFVGELTFSGVSGIINFVPDSYDEKIGAMYV